MSRWVIVVTAAAVAAGCAGGPQQRPAARAPGAAPPPKQPSAPPVAPAPAAPAARVADAPPGWYVSEPVRRDGRLRTGAIAEGAELVDVRRLAVAAGTDALRRAHGAGDPKDVQTEKIEVVRSAPGRYRAFILMSCVDEGGR